MAFAVVIIFAVGFVMLFVVRNQVVQRETIVGGNKVNAGVRFAFIVFVKIRTSGKAVGKFSQGTFFAPPEIADAIAVLAIPFAPTRREIAYLVTVIANIPGLGDKFNLRNDRILVNDIEKGAHSV